MLRKTVTRAFGRAVDPAGAEASRVAAAGDAPAAAPEVPGTRAIHEIFRDLREALRVAIQRLGATSGESPAARLSAVRAELEGQEFVLESPRGRFRFRDTMNGLIWILVESDGAARELCVLALHPDELGVPRLVEKPLAQARDPFRFASVPELVETFLAGAAAPS